MNFGPMSFNSFGLLFALTNLAIIGYALFCVHRLRMEAEEQSAQLHEIKELLRLQVGRE